MQIFYSAQSISFIASVFLWCHLFFFDSILSFWQNVSANLPPAASAALSIGERYVESGGYSVTAAFSRDRACKNAF